MVRVIWRYLRKVRVEIEKAYGLKDQLVMVGQYLWVTPQAHIVMDEFLHSQFRHHHEVAPHITIYLFENLLPRVEVLELRYKVEF